MGRKREHGAETGQALLDAAEQLVGEGGLKALSVRAVAERAGVSTRAVYSVFGSKQGLEQALLGRTFRLLGADVAALPLTDDAYADLVAAVTEGFRGFALAHPDLFRLVFTPGQGVTFGPEAREESRQAWQKLLIRIERAGVAPDGGRDVWDIAYGLDAISTGLAILELCGMIPPDRAPAFWGDTVGAYVRGLAADVGRTDGERQAGL